MHRPVRSMSCRAGRGADGIKIVAVHEWTGGIEMGRICSFTCLLIEWRMEGNYESANTNDPPMGPGSFSREIDGELES